MTDDPYILKLRNKILDLRSRIYIMGIVNVTPDSFSDGGKYFSAEKAVSHALQLVRDGADIIDIGGESSRPGSEPISIEEELDRVIPVIQKLKKNTDVVISIDTTKADVADEAIKNGADIINDISALRFDERMSMVAAVNDVPVIMMHMQGMPRNMQLNPQYDDVVREVYSFFEERKSFAIQHNVQQIMIDPGIGFGKNLIHNLVLLKNLATFTALRLPIVVGTSRKSFIGKITGKDVDERLGGTIASSLHAIINGANIIRVHDVKQMKNAAVVNEAIVHAERTVEV